MLIEDKKKSYIAYEWGVPMMSGKWGIVLRCFVRYFASLKTGELHSVVALDDFYHKTKTWQEIWQPLIWVRKDYDMGIFVGSIRHYMDRTTKEKVTEFCWPYQDAEQGAEIFKDNVEIYQQILDGTLKAADLQYILEQM